LGELIGRAFEAVLSEYGAFGALFLLLVAYLHWSRDRLWEARLKDKDQEIERLVEERNSFQDIVLRKRLTSGGRGKDHAGSR
jgi:hypothetical protein